MSQDGSAGRDLIQVGRDYIRHINVNIASGNWLMAGVGLLPAIATLLVAGTSVKLAVEKIAQKQEISSIISIPSIDSDSNIYFTNLTVIEEEYEQLKGQTLDDQKLIQKIERAIKLAKQENYQESISLFEEIAQIAQLPGIYNNLGVVYTNIRNYKAAQEAYQQVFPLAPDYQVTYFNLGLLSEFQGELKKAKDYYQKAPSLEEAKRRLNEIKLELKKEFHPRELEPNKDIFSATPIPLEKPIFGTKIGSEDQDYFSFTIPHTYRDKIKIDIENFSTTLEPSLTVFDAEKRKIGTKSANNNGANLNYYFVAEPNTKYYVEVSSRYNFQGTTGKYALTIKPLKEYDEYEPNENIFTSEAIPLEKSINAGKIDSVDQDFYQFTTSSNTKKIIVSLENQSTTLEPSITVFDAEKRNIGTKYASNNGANLDYSFDAEPNSIYYVKVSSRYDFRGATGDYNLTVKASDIES